MAPDRVRLACTWEEVVTLDPFVTTRYVQVQRPAYPGGLFAGDEYTFEAYTEPYVLYDDDLQPVPEVHVPAGEMDIHRGMKVEATDGKIGQVEALVVEPKSWGVTHLTLQAGHFWGKRDITVPISAVERVVDDIVYLKLDKQEVESLPSVPIKR
jgi:sporulation protein YlmC with PRC-barrel domain